MPSAWHSNLRLHYNNTEQKSCFTTKPLFFTSQGLMICLPIPRGLIMRRFLFYIKFMWLSCNIICRQERWWLFAQIRQQHACTILSHVSSLQNQTSRVKTLFQYRLFHSNRLINENACYNYTLIVPIGAKSRCSTRSDPGMIIVCKQVYGWKIEVGFKNRTRLYRIVLPKPVVTYENSINWFYHSATR